MEIFFLEGLDFGKFGPVGVEERFVQLFLNDRVGQEEGATKERDHDKEQLSAVLCLGHDRKQVGVVQIGQEKPGHQEGESEGSDCARDVMCDHEAFDQIFHV